MKKKLLNAAAKAAPTTRDLRAAAVERAARWAAGRVRDRLGAHAEADDEDLDGDEDGDEHGETPDQAAAARERLRARMGGDAGPARSAVAGKAAKGLAAAALALPLGLWVGSRLRNRG